MKREPVHSTSIASVGYDDATATLTIEFQSGALYEYYEVERAVYEQLRAAPSKGQFVNARVRDVYRYARVD